jgi:hypothetical protein
MSDGGVRCVRSVPSTRSLARGSAGAVHRREKRRPTGEPGQSGSRYSGAVVGYPRRRRIGQSVRVALRRRHRSQPSADVLFDAEKIDLVALARDGRSVDLIIVADAPWTGSDGQLQSLQAKVHNYGGFAADGQTTRTYPETESLPWRIVVECVVGPPDDRTNDVLGRAVEPVRRYGGDLTIHT